MSKTYKIKFLKKVDVINQHAIKNAKNSMDLLLKLQQGKLTIQANTTLVIHSTENHASYSSNDLSHTKVSKSFIFNFLAKENPNVLTEDLQINLSELNESDYIITSCNNLEFHENCYCVCVDDTITAGKEDEQLQKYHVYQLTNIKLAADGKGRTANVTGMKYRYRLKRFRVIDLNGVLKPMPQHASPFDFKAKMDAVAEKVIRFDNGLKKEWEKFNKQAFENSFNDWNHIFQSVKNSQIAQKLLKKDTHTLVMSEKLNFQALYLNDNLLYQGKVLEDFIYFINKFDVNELNLVNLNSEQVVLNKFNNGLYSKNLKDYKIKPINNEKDVVTLVYSKNSNSDVLYVNDQAIRCKNILVNLDKISRELNIHNIKLFDTTKAKFS